jgi:pimeloyl-ACP methyl ester carboxylesterase
MLAYCDMPMRHLSLILLFPLLLLGCSADQPLNPSFPVTLDEAKLAMDSMRESPGVMPRPVVVLGGINDPGFAAPSIARKLRRVATLDAQIIDVSFFGTRDFDQCRDRVLRAVETAWPSIGDETIEVDVVAVSMGGLVARYAARPRSDGGRRLNVRRLFTIATPHLGAELASLELLDDRIDDMLPGSAFLALLNGMPAETDPELFCYARLGDGVVGEENAAPPGRTPWWVANIPLHSSHLHADSDPRILADIALRLRDETPFTTDPPAPLPDAGGS